MSSESTDFQKEIMESNIYTRADICKWISVDNLPHPEWLTKVNKKNENYEAYFTTHLRSRFMEFEADFRTIVADYINKDYDDTAVAWILPTASYTLYLLNLARDALDQDSLSKQQLITASNLLDLIEECLVWIKPIETVQSQIYTLKSCLRNSKLSQSSKDYYCELLGRVQKEYDEKKELKDQEEYLLDFAHSIFEEIIWICNDADIDEIINVGLQINRLNSFLRYGYVLLLFFFLFNPLFINIDFLKAGFIPDNLITSNSTSIYNILFAGSLIEVFKAYLSTLLIAFAIAFMGGCGGFLSGLLQVRGSRTNLDLYEESMILLKIRPIFGAFAALITFILISWNVLSEIITSNPSSLFLAAFLSGFSERYFLKLLKLESENNKSTKDDVGSKEINAESVKN
jgi:hypothetical protein